MKALKIGMDVHIPGSKKGKVLALKKLCAPEDAVNGRITDPCQRMPFDGAPSMCRGPEERGSDR